MDQSGKADFSLPETLALVPIAAFETGKDAMNEGNWEVRETDSGKKHHSILLTDGRTLNYKKPVDKKRVSFGRNTEFPLSQGTQSQVPAVAESEVSMKSDLDRFLELPHSFFRGTDSLLDSSQSSTSSSLSHLLFCKEQLNLSMTSILGISYTQPSESQLSALERENAELETRLTEVQEAIKRVEGKLQADQTENGNIEIELSRTQEEVEKAVKSTITESQQNVARLRSRLAMYQNLTGISFPLFTGGVLTGVCKGLETGELKFELRFLKEGGCTYKPVVLQIHGLDEMLKHQISGLADCELVMLFRRMLKAVVYR